MAQRNLGWICCIAAIVALYFWGLWIAPQPSDHVGAYNRMADAFVHGQLHLRDEPPPGLLALPDPWEPTQNYPYAGLPYVFDYTLHGKHLYPYWGPVPVLVPFLPAHLLGLGNVSERLVTVLWCLVLVALCGLLVREVLRRWVPQAPSWAEPASVFVLATAGGILPLTSRGSTYTLAIAAGEALLVGALLMLLRGLPDDGPPRVRELAVGSLLIGLAVGSRWNLAPAGLVVVALAAWLWRREAGGERQRLALALLGPIAACAVVLMIYNAVRFGSPLNIGARDQIVAFSNFHATGTTGPPSFRAVSYYFLKPFQLAAYFPYLWLNVNPTSGYRAQDPVAGLLWTMPIVFAIPFAVVVLKDAARRLAVVIGGLAVLGIVIFLPHTKLVFAGVRYATDFAPLLAIAAVLACIALIGRRLAARPESVRLIGGLVAAGAAVMALVNVALSENIMLLTHPRLLADVDNRLDGLPTAAAFVLDKPIISTIAGRPDLPGHNDPTQPLVPGRLAPPLTIAPTAPLSFDVLAPRSGPLVVRARLTPTGSVVPGAQLTPLVVLRGASSAGRQIDGSVQQLEVRGRRGRNRVTLSLIAGAGAATGGNAVQIDDLRVSQR